LKIIIETETPHDSATMFRVLLDDRAIGEGLTAVQAQIVAAEIIERLVLPVKANSSMRPSPSLVWQRPNG
jgi:hypothetical protein